MGGGRFLMGEIPLYLQRCACTASARGRLLGAGSSCDSSGRDWYFVAEQSASAPHMLRIVPHSVALVSRSCELFPDGFDLHLLHSSGIERTEMPSPRPWKPPPCAQCELHLKRSTCQGSALSLPTTLSCPRRVLQGYLTHDKTHQPRTLP